MQPDATPSAPRVHVVYDDPVVLRAISRLLDASGIEAVTWTSSAEFLGSARLDAPACVLLDVSMPDRTGPEVQEELRRRGVTATVVFLTAHGDVPTSVRAMKGGATDFLLKPMDPDALLSAVRDALHRSARSVAALAETEAVRRRHDTLTPRERDVMREVVNGASSKESAVTLGIAENTVKVHRSRLMGKMGAGSVADLVQMSVLLRILDPDRPERT